MRIAGSRNSTLVCLRKDWGYGSSYIATRWHHATLPAQRSLRYHPPSIGYPVRDVAVPNLRTPEVPIHTSKVQLGTAFAGRAFGESMRPVCAAIGKPLSDVTCKSAIELKGNWRTPFARIL